MSAGGPDLNPSTLDGCGCCEPLTQEGAVENRPGLPSLRYRIGRHPTFLQRMLRHLPSEKTHAAGDEQHPLQAFTTRSEDDPAVAILDAWAVVADVLTFYQERTANEGFLRTATERRSVLELARAIGYELNPGVAASTFLAFAVDDGPSAASAVSLPSGTRVQSVPGPGALPQTFETTADLEARPEWNAVRPQLTEPWRPKAGDTSVYVKGVETQLQSGDAILIVGDERAAGPGSEWWDLRILQTVTPDPTNDRTLLDWADPSGLPPTPDRRSRGPLGSTHTSPAQQNPRLFALRLRAGLFGYNAPDWRALPSDTRAAYDPELQLQQWPGFDIQRDPPVIDLDAQYPKVLPGGWLALTRPGWTELYRALTVSPASRTDFTLSSRVTRIQLDSRENLSFFGVRNTVVYAQSEELTPAETPITAPVEGDRIVLDRVVELFEGQAIALTIERPPQQAGAPPVGEVAIVERVRLGDGGMRTVIDLTEDLDSSYERGTVFINANVVRATHGESVKEVLGSGDATTPNQTFALKRPPLTFVSAATPNGSASTLTVRVEGMAWSERRSLFASTTRDRVYVVRLGDDGTGAVTFGDGSSGARLPTGVQNVVATYRTGIGPDGEVAAGALTLLQSRPLGVRSVENPVAATDSASPEQIEDARRNAPLTVLTLDRLVSLTDYEDFVRSFAGIGKAKATSLWNGSADLIHVTVARPGGKALERPSDLYDNLVAAIDLARDPVREVRIASFRSVLFCIHAGLRIDPARLADEVMLAAGSAIRSAFAFEQRDFGQPVLAAEVITVIQSVDGVVAVDLDELYVLDEHGQPIEPLLSPALTAAQATVVEAMSEYGDSAGTGSGQILAAQLLSLAAEGVALEVIES